MQEAAIAQTGSRWKLPLFEFVSVAVAMLLLALASMLLNARAVVLSSVSIIWLPNGLLVGILICRPRKRWPLLMLLGLVVDTSVNAVLGSPPISALFFAFCNMTEVLLAASLTQRNLAPIPDLTQAVQLRSFLIYAVFLAPAVTSTIAAIYIHLHTGTPLFLATRYWYAADLLGMALMTPLYLSIHRHRLRIEMPSWETIGLFVLLCFATFVCFRLVHWSILWVVLLCLLLIGVRIGFTGSAAALLTVMFIGGYYTSRGFGPLTWNPGDSFPTRLLLLQAFVACCMLALYVTEVARTRARRVRANLELSEARFRSLAETSRDVIILADIDGTRRYISPSVTELAGYAAEEMLGSSLAQDVHPEDTQAVETTFAQVLAGQSTPPLAYRTRTKDGTYRWTELNARLMTDAASGAAKSLVYVLRDIADRKRAEADLLDQFHAAEKLATVDGLTGIANRRILDRNLDAEWRRAKREKTPISFLLIDVDHFKAFNDLYGHLAGDECLRAIAHEAEKCLQRMTDTLARYGGEEFAGVLPNTSIEHALEIAERVRLAVVERHVPHAGNASGIVTVSIGVATLIPTLDGNLKQLIRAADAALYRAKANGRNCLSLGIIEDEQLQQQSASD